MKALLYIQKYIACKKKITVEKCGFVIHPKHGWLGASPDARVVDTACNEPNGIVEIKCPCSNRDVTPEEACKGINFYCEFKDACVTLKSNHSYYHQVQLQLYVGSDLYCSHARVRILINVTLKYTHAYKYTCTYSIFLTSPSFTTIIVKWFYIISVFSY